jgi:ketosteroid isomerase-like protein
MPGTVTATASEASLLEAALRLAEAERQGDVVALEQLLAPEYQGYDPAGRSQDRTGVLRAYREGEVRIAALRQSDMRATVVGDVGLVAGISALTGRQGAEEFDFRLRFLDVYVWRDGRWQLIASQDTRLPR